MLILSVVLVKISDRRKQHVHELVVPCVRSGDYRYVNTEYVEGGVIFTIVRKTDRCRCSECGSENVWRQGSVTQPYRALPIGRSPVTLRAEIPRLLCHDCGKTRQAVIGFAEPRST